MTETSKPSRTCGLTKYLDDGILGAVPNWGNEDEFDPDYDGRPIDPGKIIGGWDREELDRDKDCDGDLRRFFGAISELRSALNSGEVTVERFSDILNLTRSNRPWRVYVDPAYSVESYSTGAVRVVAMWECSEHIFGLAKGDENKWSVVEGLQQITDLEALLNTEEELPESEYEGELEAPKSILDVDRTEEDRERMELLSTEEASRLEDDANHDGNA